MALLCAFRDRGTPESAADYTGPVDNGLELRTWACPRLAPGSGCGSVEQQTTLLNGVEPQRYCCWVSPLRADIPHATAP